MATSRPEAAAHGLDLRACGALRILSRLERAAEAMRAALNALAEAAPEWVREHADPEWFERYSRRIEDYRLPKGKEARMEYLKTVGTDGIRLLAKLDDPEAAPQSLQQLPEEVEILHRIREQQYVEIEGGVRVLDPKEMPEAAHHVESSYETEARYSTYSKRAGIEGTFSQGVRAFGLRQARYRGLKRTHLQGLATAAAFNVGRVSNWLNGVLTAATRGCYELDQERHRNAENGGLRGTEPTRESAFLCDFHPSS